MADKVNLAAKFASFDEVYVPKFRERCKVRKINKQERVVTVEFVVVVPGVGGARHRDPVVHDALNHQLEYA